ncbi:hypothetical protein TWF696_001494 [Orbilia brochopaga]|uniref:Phosphoinositide phospholipase C n=1 Tax=Orbilia brochopaga TaxID=3140254 RepID=A0AAV9U9M2_9PEZI
MATVDPTAQVGGGIASNKQAHTPLEISSEALLNELKTIYSASSAKDLPFNKFVESFSGPDSNAILPPPSTDLNHPLTSYFISSSHNTYLTDHQLYGSSTADGYINVLTRACRCVEIDVWDGDDGWPKVDHGWTLTKDIKFKDACEAIAQYAFVASDLPIIVSLECHAGMEQQEKMVSIMKTAWKDLLLLGELPDWNVAEKGLPPPALLKNKILVKVKYLPPDAQPGGPASQMQSLNEQTKSLTLTPTPSAGADDDDDECSDDPDQKKKAPKVKISAALSALGVYASAMKFAESFTDAISKRPNHVFSFSEKKFNSLHEAHADALFQHNRHFLTRVYPHGLRVSSSNLNPHDFWRRGAQLVALNWQKVDRGMMFNEAMFSGTGGYVLKPASHLPNLQSSVTLKDLEKTIDLQITVLAAQNLPLPEGDDKPSGFRPYVKCIVHVSQMVKYKDKTKPGKGIHYGWGAAKGAMSFPRMRGVVEELAFVRFKVYDDELGKDSKAAWACVRLDRLKMGHGFLKLFDMKGNKSDGVLLIKVDKAVH